ncbi:MAG: UvrD-helicase domain-containing protein, partial [Alphaproteobacteria bacterium]
MAARGQRAAADYLEVLNPEQRLAVETIDGPVLVLAGAGTGKTRVLTTRIAHILAQRLAWPSEILAVTFTNKAAREMRERIGHLVGQAVEGMPWLGTFHATGVKILRRHAELVGLRPDFTILDTDDQIRLIRQLIAAEHIDEKRWPARVMATAIDGWKNRALTPKTVPSGEAEAYCNGLGRKIYADYQDRLKVLNAADFGDLLTETIRLFRENPTVLAEYQRKFRYVLVDEYQDTNVAQYLWLRLLTQKQEGRPQNLCCVGDDDQSIYGWRGAEVDNILRFDKDFPGAQVVRLERNYRSTGHILAAASYLIAHNQGRLGKTLFTDGETGELPVLTSCWDSEEEARSIGEECEQLQRQSKPLNEVAILVRASFQMREFEERFITIGLPYRVIGGPRFYERAEIRDALAYLRVVAQPADDLAFERIVNTPKRGLGDTALRKMHEIAREERIPLTMAAAKLVQGGGLAGKAKAALSELLHGFARWREGLAREGHVVVAATLLDESGYTDMWKQDKSPEAPGRLDNLKEFIRALGEFESLAGFLEHVALVMETDENAQGDRLSLMTLHAAKGLEFDMVFLPGWEEGLFPHARAMDEGGEKGLEEERRLAYVGLTRARKLAIVSSAANRRMYGNWSSSIPSRFLDELPAEHIQREGSTGMARNRVVDMPSVFAAGGLTARKPRTIEAGAWEVQARPAHAEPLQVGDRVFHKKFGYGRVTGVDDNKVDVNFD